MNAEGNSFWDKAYRTIRSRYQGLPQETLPFEMPEQRGRGGDEGTRKQKGPRAVRWAKCPQCLTDRLIGVIRTSDGREVLRDHNRVLQTGRRMPCPGSGQEAPDDDI